MSDIAQRPMVRAARPADAATIAHVHRDSWRTTYAGILPLAVIAREAGRKSEGMWRRRLALARGRRSRRDRRILRAQKVGGIAIRLQRRVRFFV